MREAGGLSVVALSLLFASVCGAQQEPPRPLQDESRVSLLREIEKRMAATSALVATFRQSKRMSLFKQPMNSSGVLYFVRPDLLRWEILEPFRSILVASGDEIAKYEVVGESRRQAKMGRTADTVMVVMDHIRQWFAGRFIEDEQFRIEVYDAPVRLVFRPRTDHLAKTLPSIDLSLNTTLDEITVVRVVENNGDETVMDFTVLARDVELPRGAFDVDGPADIDLPIPKRTE